MQFVADNLIWITVAFVSGGMLLWPLIRGKTGGPAVSPMQATQLINREDAIVVDVRDQQEYAKGHIPNARHIPLAQFDKRIDELEKFKKRPVIVNCQSGNRSYSACAALRKSGFEKVFNLDGGASAWEQAGLPLTTK